MLSAKPVEEDPSSQAKPPRAAPDLFPFYVVPGVSNFRDIGGWESITHFHSIRKGVIFRGSDTNGITPEGIAKLHELGIKTDFDLRSKQQIEKAGGYKEMEGIQRIWTPVFADEQYTEEAARQRYELYASENPEDVVSAFIEILISGASMFRTVLRHLLETVPPVDSDRPTPAIFMHCTTGNNRTGVFIAVLLLLFRVRPTYIIRDYIFSEYGLAPTRHINVERLLKKGAFKEYGPEEAKRRCERMVSARPESMSHLMKEIDRRWGGAPGYFRDVVGLSEDEIHGLRKLLIVEEKPHHDPRGIWSR